MKGGSFVSDLTVPAVHSRSVVHTWAFLALGGMSLVPSEAGPCWGSGGVLVLPLPQETLGPCGEPFTAKSCLERGLQRLN